jgi:hypothetical protein
MLEMAQEMFKALQDRLRTTLRVMADLAESVGVPPTVTTLFTPKERAQAVEEPWAAPERPAPAPVQAPRPADDGNGKHAKGADKVRALRTDDEINGSTYLARILWSLGVAELEGQGPLRPADMARMIMSRSPVSLEPPNVARYIRRSKPTCIEVARTEGSSSFYQLNDEGHALFEELFRNKK